MILSHLALFSIVGDFFFLVLRNLLSYKPRSELEFKVGSEAQECYQMHSLSGLSFSEF